MGFKTTKLTNGTRVVRRTDAVPEWKLQAAQVRALRAMPEFGRRFTLAGDQNAARRGVQTATIAKATGMTPGEHDLRLYLEGGRLGLIENKTEKGRLSPEQRDRHALLYRLGFTYQTVIRATSEADAAAQAVAVVRGWLAGNENATPPDDWKKVREHCS
ncbi:MAG: VRR-NUC domain-containing protein [Xanthobacteraceae bacterium]